MPTRLLRVVRNVTDGSESEVVKESQGGESVGERFPAAVIPEDEPFLEPRQGVFDSCATPGVPPVAPLAEYPV